VEEEEEIIKQRMSTKGRSSLLSKKKRTNNSNKENIDPISRTIAYKLASSLPSQKSMPITWIPTYVPWTYPETFDTNPLRQGQEVAYSLAGGVVGHSGIAPVTYNVLGSSTENSAQSEPDEKYKTELCKNWVQSGRCSYGNKCRFAHGPDDLINKQIFNPKYKSKKCEAFHNALYCPYGARCNFMHDEGNNYKSRVFYYTYLLDPQNKHNTIKYVLVKYLEELFSAASTGGNNTQDILFDKFVGYIKDGGYLRRLPVFVKLSEVESIPKARVRNSHLQKMLQELFNKFLHDHKQYREEKEYKKTLNIFIILLINLYPELREIKSIRFCTCIDLLQLMYNNLILQQENIEKQSFERGMKGLPLIGAIINHFD